MTGPHSHHDHAHDQAPRRALALEPGWSLLRLSAGRRLAFAGAIVATLWATLALLLRWI